MPLGSQDDPDTIPPAVQRLDIDGREVTLTLHDLAGEMRLMIQDDDRAGTRDVLSALATRLLPRAADGDRDNE
ncbi:MAG TPA: hypothetical protein VM287_13905 [Egibacteraceae bacterium]|nr:hypothetical protein [Egibacteraceae bacterium]